MNVGFRISEIGPPIHYSLFEEFVNALSSCSDGVVVYHHPIGHKKGDENPHYHGFVKNYTKTDHTFRDTIKDIFNVNRSAYGCRFDQSKLPEDKTIAYMTKGKHDPHISQGYTDEYLAQRKAEGYDPDDEVREKALKRKVKDIFRKVEDGDHLTDWELIVVMEEECRKQHLDYNFSHHIKEVMTIITEVMTKHKRKIHKYNHLDFYFSLFMKVDPRNFVEWSTMEIQKKMSW